FSRLTGNRRKRFASHFPRQPEYNAGCGQKHRSRRDFPILFPIFLHSLLLLKSRKRIVLPASILSKHGGKNKSQNRNMAAFSTKIFPHSFHSAHDDSRNRQRRSQKLFPYKACLLRS